VIERIVAPLGLRVDATSPWVDARDFREALGCRPAFLGPFFGARPRTGRRALRLGADRIFPALDFEDSGPISSFDAAAPLQRLSEAIPERPKVANPRSI
jgi:hypothetical protein